MKIQRTIYHLIVDRSGSMSDCIDATINGFNNQLNRIRSLEREFPEQEILVGVTLFNENLVHVNMIQPLSGMSQLSRENYIPAGCTALLDAVGMTSILISERESSLLEKPTTFVVVVLTDGYENSSRVFNLEQVRTLIQKHEATGRWTFSFIGATLDAVDIAQQMSIKAKNSYRFDKASMKGEVWDKLSTSMTNYFSKKQSGKDLSDLFGDD